MPKFRCLNKECSEYNVIELIPHVRYKFDKITGKLISDKAICKQCGKEREQLSEGSLTRMPWFKGENDKNHDNKKVKQYDYDRSLTKKG